MPCREVPEHLRIEEMLHIFLDLYEKDSIQLSTMLESDPDGWIRDGSNYVSLKEQGEIIGKSSEKSQREIRQKTLISTRGKHPRNRNLKEAIADPNKVDAWMGRFKPDRFTEKLAAIEGLPVEEFLAKEIREELAKEKIDVELLRFFADHLESLVDAIDLLDDTDFAKLVPDVLVAPFRELHMNAVLGNYGTAVILCGALLERTLQDLIPSKSLLNDLIKEAKTDGLLKDHNKRYADRIRDDRNNVVHGKVDFGSISSDHAWETVSCTRTLISALYKDRLD